MDYYKKKIVIYRSGKVKERIYDNSISKINKDTSSAKLTDNWENDTPYKDTNEMVYDIITQLDKKYTSVIDERYIEEKEKEKRCEELKKISSSSLSRTRKLLVDYITNYELDFTSFITLTFKGKPDIEECTKKFQNYCRSVKRVYPEFMYIGVPEFQKRGVIHYHILTNIKCDSELIPRQPKKRVYDTKSDWYKTIEFYNIKYWSKEKNGNSQVLDIINDTDDKFEPVAYMMKYFYKDLDNRLFGNKKILKSNNIKKPETILITENGPLFKDTKEYLDTYNIPYKEKYYNGFNVDTGNIYPAYTDRYIDFEDEIDLIEYLNYIDRKRGKRK